MDLIERQKAIDAMANTLWHYPNECYRNLNEYEFAKGLAELGLKSVPSAQPEPKWIPVSERLPKEDTDVLVTYVNGEETRIAPVNYGHSTWYDCVFETTLDPLKVTAWMPLPEPYAERRTDDLG